MKSEINNPKAIAENDVNVFQDVVVEKALAVCDILKYEFIFCKPCQDLEHVIIDTLGTLCSTGIITLKEEAYLDEELWSRRYARTFDDSSDEEYSNTFRTSKIQYKVKLLQFIFDINIRLFVVRKKIPFLYCSLVSLLSIRVVWNTFTHC